MIFLYPTGGGESWHQPCPGLWLWDRSDQQARPAAGLQECGAGGYDGEFPGWGPKLPAGQGGQSRDVLLQKPPGIHTGPAKIWRHLDSVGFRLVLCDPSGLTSHRTGSLCSKDVLKSLGLLPKTSWETPDSSPKPQWVQIKLVFSGHIQVLGEQPACRGAPEGEALYMDFLQQEYPFLVAWGTERYTGPTTLLNSGFWTCWLSKLGGVSGNNQEKCHSGITSSCKSDQVLLCSLMFIRQVLLAVSHSSPSYKKYLLLLLQPPQWMPCSI